MKDRLSPWDLEATLYMPATREDIADTALYGKILGLHSLVIYLGDAVSEADIPAALKNPEHLLHELSNSMRSLGKNDWPLVFIRPRHAKMDRCLEAHYDLFAVDGFALPKLILSSLAEWWDVMGGTHLCMVPTLETEDILDVVQMHELATHLVEHPCHDRIIALRIGDSDPMNVVPLCHPRDLTLYDNPMGYIIKMFVSVFGSRDFTLAALVCGYIDDHVVMARELALDIAHRLVGKTAIRPGQTETIQNVLMVTQGGHSDALRILSSTQTVFKSQGTMYEPATHRRWTAGILDRVRFYGLQDEQSADGIRLLIVTQYH